MFHLSTPPASPEIKYQRTRIVLAEDHPLMRQALKLWIEKQQDLEIVAEVSDGMQAVDIAFKLHPDIIIMDISMPKLNGLGATKQILSKYPNIKVLIVTVHADKEHIVGILKAGASGYMTKKASGEEIIRAIRGVILGETVLPDDVSLDTLGEVIASHSQGLNKLNSREAKLLVLIAQGLSNNEIAMKLGLSLRRVKANITTLFLKLGVSSRTEAIKIGLREGLITIDQLKD